MSRYARLKDDEDYLDRSDRRQKKTRRRHKSYSEEESDTEKDSDEVLPRWKIITVFAIIGICFAMLFPNVFGPILTSIFGRKDAQPTQNAGQPHHPFMDKAGGKAPRPSGPSHRGPGPGRMPQGEIPQVSGRGGMMSWMLPIYTIGVMGFLVYTLFKMNRKKKKKRRRYDEDESEYSQESEDESDTGGFGRKKLRSIQTRLRETEEAMAKILEQLEEVAKAAPETLNPEELKAQYSADKIRETELNLQELNRLNSLRTKQQRQIEKSLGEEELEDEEVGEEIGEEIQSTSEPKDTKSENPIDSDIEDDLMISEVLESIEDKEELNTSKNIEPDDPKPSKKKKEKVSQNEKTFESQSTMFENQLFSFDEPQKQQKGQKSKQKGKSQKVEDYETPSLLNFEENESKSKQKGKKVEDYEAPSLLSLEKTNSSTKFTEVNKSPKAVEVSGKSEKLEETNRSTKVNEVNNSTDTKEENGKLEEVNETQTSTSITKEENNDEPDLISQLEKAPKKYTTDAKRPLRRAKRKKPFGDDQQSKVDQEKIEEQKQIVKELSSSHEPVEKEESSPKQNNSKNNKNKSNKKNGRNKKGNSKQDDSSETTEP